MLPRANLYTESTVNRACFAGQTVARSPGGSHAKWSGSSRPASQGTLATPSDGGGGRGCGGGAVPCTHAEKQHERALVAPAQSHGIGGQDGGDFNGDGSVKQDGAVDAMAGRGKAGLEHLAQQLQMFHSPSSPGTWLYICAFRCIMRTHTHNTHTHTHTHTLLTRAHRQSGGLQCCFAPR